MIEIVTYKYSIWQVPKPACFSLFGLIEKMRRGNANHVIRPRGKCVPAFIAKSNKPISLQKSYKSIVIFELKNI